MRGVALAAWTAACALWAAPGCDDSSAPTRTPDPSHWRFAREVVLFEPGPGAGFGADAMPDRVLGPPRGAGPLAGGLEVVSLGVGGHIVLAFDAVIVDGPGPDLAIFENAFWPMGRPEHVFAELAEVAVSQDGVRWHTFPCAPGPAEPGRWPGCAGWTPVGALDRPSPELEQGIGGDRFDLADLGLTWARYVRVLDLSTDGVAPTAGFDLDAAAAIHWALEP